jgi:hypothetical protein
VQIGNNVGGNIEYIGLPFEKVSGIHETPLEDSLSAAGSLILFVTDKHNPSTCGI